MKIIATDNFDRDPVPDVLVAENVSEFYAPPLVKFLNDTFSGLDAPRFFKAKPDDYKLYEWEP